MQVMEQFSLQGKVALVIGGAGLYGTQITTALAQAGATVYVTTRNKENLSGLEEQFRSAGVNVTAKYADQAIESTLVDLKDELMQTEGQIDVLVCNAVGRVTDGWNGDTEKFDLSMKINATGIYSLTKIFGNEMEKKQSGSIIFIGSMQGMIGPDGTLYEGLGMDGFSPDYYFHKGGMINFARFVASYYGKSNVRCNIISPGGIQSHRTPAEFVERYNKRTLLNRMANDTDLMGITVFLASDASAYITGANIPVDGGYTAK